MNKELSQIRDLIGANQISQARAKLETYLESRPDDAQGWFFASFVQPTAALRLSAIRRAAKLKPGQSEIQKRLVKLESASEAKQKRRWLPALIIVILAFVVVLVVVAISPNLRPSDGSDELPTVAVLQAVTGMPTQQTPTVESQSEQASLPSGGTPVLQPQMTSVNLEATAVGSPVESTVQTAVVSLVASTPVFITPQPNNTLSLPTASADVTLDAFTTPSPTVTSTPVSIIPTQSTVAGSTSIPIVMPVLPLSSVITISAGEFRVVDATRGAESMIQSLGGSFPPAPANQSWFLLELLLVCKNSPNCTFDPSRLKITGASGAIYGYSPELNLIPMFGTITQDNQIWGYLGFVIPTNETALKLTLSENGQTYAIGLE